MRAEQGQPHHFTLVRLKQHLGRDDVAERLGHLFRTHVDEAVVHPVTRQRRTVVRTAALRDLVFVVREDEVEAAGVDVYRLAQMLPDHRRAFDVPAGAAAPPRAVPADLRCIARLPQHEVGGIALVRRHLDPRAGDHRLAVAFRERPIVGIAGDGEEHVPFRFIGMALGDQSLDHRDHGRDFLRRVRRDGRRPDAKRAHVVEIMPLVTLGDDRDIDAFVRRRRHDLVVDVGDVARVDHVAVGIGVLEHAAE